MTENRLSLNTATIKRAGLIEAVHLAADAGYAAVGLWRDRVQEVGAVRVGEIVAAAGLRVSSLCRGGFLTVSTDAGIRAALENNRRAIEEAAAVGAGELVLVVGGLGAATAPGGPADPGADKDIAAARRRVQDRLADLVPTAVEHGVRLDLEPLHPMFAADRAVVSTLEQALDLAAPFAPEAVGVVVDSYHVWWDPALLAGVSRAGAERRIACYQVSDWVLPLAADPLLSRGHVGDGYIDIAALTRAVAASGYRGDVETEIFNQAIWDAPFEDVVATGASRYTRFVAPHL